MDASRILVIGLEQNHFRSSPLVSNINLSEFGAVIWYARSVHKELGEMGQNPGSLDRVTRRIVELLEWVKRGHVLVIIGNTEHNTVRFHFKNESVVHDFHAHEPFASLQFEPRHGQLIEAVGSDPLKTFLQPILQFLHYEVILKSTSLVPILRVSRGSQGSDLMVGGFKRWENGFVIFAPPVAAGNAKAQIAFHNLLVDLPKYFSATPDELPAWASDFVMDFEKQAMQRNVSLENQIAGLRAQVSENCAIIDGAETFKQLFTGSGKSFESAVATALREIGLKVVGEGNNRSDLLASDGRRIMAVEAKGLDGAAREEHLRQVERWVADVNLALVASDEQKAIDSTTASYASLLAELGCAPSPCKGLLVVNGYRKVPLPERTAANFPNPVLETIQNRSTVCAISGLQLLAFALEARKNPSSKPAIQDALFTTNGVISDFDDWQRILSIGTRSDAL